MKIPSRRSAARRSRTTLYKPTAMAQMKRAKRRAPQMGTPVVLKRKKANTFAASLMQKMRRLRTLTAVADSWKDGEPPEEVAIDSKGSTTVSAGVVPAIDNGLFSGRTTTLMDKNVYPYIVKNTTRTRQSTNNSSGGAQGQRFYTTFETGIPNTSTMNRLGRLNGTASLKTANTLYDTATNYISGARRQNLELRTGFNQKLIASNTAMHFQNAELYELYDLGDLAYARDKKQRIYGMTKNFYQKVQLMNANAYKSVKVKVSLYAMDQAPSLSASVSIGNIFPNPVQLSTQAQKMPNRYVFSEFQTTADWGYGYCDPVATPVLSPLFANRHTHVKSFIRTLNPGDFWDFKYVHHCGGGIRLDRLKEWAEGSPNGVLGYTMVIELVGTPCEAIIQNQPEPNVAANGSSVLGTSPGYLKLEYEKGHTSVLDSTPEFSTTEPVGGILTGANQFAIRSFAEREFAQTTQKINFGPSRIGRKGEPATDIYIPVMTDQTLDFVSGIEELDDN